MVQIGKGRRNYRLSDRVVRGRHRSSLPLDAVMGSLGGGGGGKGKSDKGGSGVLLLHCPVEIEGGRGVEKKTVSQRLGLTLLPNHTHGGRV